MYTGLGSCINYLWNDNCTNDLIVMSMWWSLPVQRGISSSAPVSRQLEIYKNDDARVAVRDIKDGDTLLVGGI